MRDRRLKIIAIALVAIGLFVAIVVAALYLGGAFSRDSRTVTGMGRTATLQEQDGDTRLTITGPEGRTEISITREKALEKIALPVYPEAEPVEGSEKRILSDRGQTESFSARFRARAQFGDVENWYRERISDKPVRAKALGIRMAVFTRRGEESGDVGSATLQQKDGSEFTEITLLRVRSNTEPNH